MSLKTANVSRKCLTRDALSRVANLCLMYCPGSLTKIWELFVQGGKFVRAVLSRGIIFV